LSKLRGTGPIIFRFGFQPMAISAESEWFAAMILFWVSSSYWGKF